jgi:hypothetical protein
MFFQLARGLALFQLYCSLQTNNCPFVVLILFFVHRDLIMHRSNVAEEFNSILTLVASMRQRRVDEKSNFSAYPTRVQKIVRTYEVKFLSPDKLK